jgi:hypothetical protein
MIQFFTGLVLGICFGAGVVAVMNISGGEDE